MQIREWAYLVEELKGSTDSEAVHNQLSELGDLGWEAVTAWTVPGNPGINRGAPALYILFKRPSEK